MRLNYYIGLLKNVVPHHMAHGAKNTTLLGIPVPIKSKTPLVLFVKGAIQGEQRRFDTRVYVCALR